MSIRVAKSEQTRDRVFPLSGIGALVNTAVRRQYVIDSALTVANWQEHLLQLNASHSARLGASLPDSITSVDDVLPLILLAILLGSAILFLLLALLADSSTVRRLLRHTGGSHHRRHHASANSDVQLSQSSYSDEADWLEMFEDQEQVQNAIETPGGDEDVREKRLLNRIGEN